MALSIIIPQMRVLVNWYGRFLYSPLGSSQKLLSLFLNSQEWLPPTPPLKINTTSKSELNRNFNQNAKIPHLQSHLLALYSSLVLRPFAGYTFTCSLFHSFFSFFLFHSFFVSVREGEGRGRGGRGERDWDKCERTLGTRLRTFFLT